VRAQFDTDIARLGEGMFGTQSGFVYSPQLLKPPNAMPTQLEQIDFAHCTIKMNLDNLIAPVLRRPELLRVMFRPIQYASAIGIRNERILTY